MTLFIGGLVLGSLYALIALGFVVIYKSSQVFNFAQGEFVMVGAYLVATLATIPVTRDFNSVQFVYSPMPWWLAVVLGLLGAGLLALVVERTILRRLVGRPVYVSIILTIILGGVIHVLVLLIWGTGLIGYMPTPWDELSELTVAGLTISTNDAVALLAAAAALGGYFVLVRYTRFGLSIRASSSDQEAALSLGVRVGRVFGATWFIAGVLAGVAGICLAMFPRAPVDGNLGFVALAAFPAVIVGGLDSAPGTVIAGFALGLLQVMAEAYINPLLGTFGTNFHTVFPFVVMIAFLLIRPYGLFGTHEVQRV